MQRSLSWQTFYTSFPFLQLCCITALTIPVILTWGWDQYLVTPRSPFHFSVGLQEKLLCKYCDDVPNGNSVPSVIANSKSTDSQCWGTTWSQKTLTSCTRQSGPLCPWEDPRAHYPQTMVVTYLPLSHKVAWKSPQVPSSMGYPPVISSLAPLWKLERRIQSQIILSKRGRKAVKE